MPHLHVTYMAYIIPHLHVTYMAYMTYIMAHGLHLHTPDDQPSDIVAVEMKAKPHGQSQEEEAMLEVVQDIGRGGDELVGRSAQELLPGSGGEDELSGADLAGFVENVP